MKDANNIEILTAKLPKRFKNNNDTNLMTIKLVRDNVSDINYNEKNWE